METKVEEVVETGSGTGAAGVVDVGEVETGVVLMVVEVVVVEIEVMKVEVDDGGTDEDTGTTGTTEAVEDDEAGATED